MGPTFTRYCGSILAAALGAAALSIRGYADAVKSRHCPDADCRCGDYPFYYRHLLRAYQRECRDERAEFLAFGTNLSSVLIVVATFLILWLLKLDNWLWISCSVVVGLVVGIVIGRSTEYYTSQSYRPTRKLEESGKTGPATVIISGIGLGMLSTAIPVIAVVVGIISLALIFLLPVLTLPM